MNKDAIITDVGLFINGRKSGYVVTTDKGILFFESKDKDYGSTNIIQDEDELRLAMVGATLYDWHSYKTVGSYEGSRAYNLVLETSRGYFTMSIEGAEGPGDTSGFCIRIIWEDRL